MAGSITQEVVVLNNFGLEERRRTTGSGTTNRYTVTIKADPLPHIFDPKELGRGPAEAIAEAIRAGIRAINQNASESTILRRKGAALAMGRAERWAMARYAGGRTGPKQPGQSDKLFNDSGRLADGIAVGPNGDGWVVNVTANRLDPDTFVGKVPALVAMYERLVALVPALQGPSKLLEIESVKEAINASIYNVIVTTRGMLGRNAKQLKTDIAKRRGQLLADLVNFTGLNR